MSESIIAGNSSGMAMYSNMNYKSKQITIYAVYMYTNTIDALYIDRMYLIMNSTMYTADDESYPYLTTITCRLRY